MDRQDALKLIEQVCASFRGTLQEHQTIQEALQTLKKEEQAEVIEK